MRRAPFPMKQPFIVMTRGCPHCYVTPSSPVGVLREHLEWWHKANQPDLDSFWGT